jgi:hypothetical protein
MIIKKLFFATSILFLTGTVLPSEEPQPEETQSTTQYIKANLANFLLYMQIGLHMTYNYGVNYINYIKSYFWPKQSSTLIPPHLAQNTASPKDSNLQIVSKPLESTIIPAQPQNAEKALASVKQNLLAISSLVPSIPSPGKASEGKPKPDLKQLLAKAKKQPSGKKSEPIQEIDSPAIQTEKTSGTQKQLSQLVQHAKELNMAIEQLPATEWPLWQEKQTTLLTPAIPALKNAIEQSIKSSWQEHGAEILKLAIQATNMGITGALGVFAAQYTKMATGNIETLDTDALLVTFLTYASAALIEKTNTLLTSNPAIQSTITAGETNILFQAILAPSVQNKTYQFKMPLFRGVIDALIMNEASAIMNTMLEQNGEITEAIKKIKIKEILLGKKKTSPSSNPFVALALPKVKTVINNQKFALALAEVGWIFFQSATLGGLFWAAGLGYANTTFAESMNNAVLTGMAQGIVANIAALTNNTTPGALVSISTIPLSQQMVANTGVNIATTPQAMITGVLQAIATEATNFIVNEADKSGGFFASLQKGKEALGSAVSSRWASTWASITDVWENMQEIEPVPL